MARRAPILCFLLFLGVFAFGRAASADPMPSRPDEASAEPRLRSRWYGSHTLAADGLSLALFFVAASTESDEVATAGGVTYLLGGPAVHLGHERVGAAFGSLGFRVGLPLTGALIGTTAAGCSRGAGGDFCGLGEVAMGVLVGAVSAVALDAVLLAREPVREARGEVSLAVTPTYSRRDRASGVALLGTF